MSRLDRDGLPSYLVIQNEFDLEYRQPLALRLLAERGISYQRIPFRLRNAYGRYFSRRGGGRSFPVDTRGTDPGATTPWRESFALCLTHDIDTSYGMNVGASLLAEVERRLDVVSTWCVVPSSAQYGVDADRLRGLVLQGHEVASHELKHDGRFAYVSTEERTRRIAQSRTMLVGQGFRVAGFRAPLLHRTRDMIGILEDTGYAWDSSFPDTDPTSPGYEGSGCASVFPFRPLIEKNGSLARSAVLELPITLAQDWTLIHSLGFSERQLLSHWKRKMETVAKLGGIALLLTHPDRYDMGHPARVRIYEELIKHALSMGPVVGTCATHVETWNRQVA